MTLSVRRSAAGLGPASIIGLGRLPLLPTVDTTQQTIPRYGGCRVQKFELRGQHARGARTP